MEILKFEDGQLVKAGYVTIDGVQYEVTPAEYSGNTPLSSYNLNRMQEKILEDGITVNPTEPIEENRRKVWFQKGDSEVASTIYIKNNNNIYEEFIRKEQKNIITASANDNYTTTTTGTEKLTLIETAKIGDKLEILDGGIKIGKGITHIKVTGQIFYSGGVNNGDVLGLYIYKNKATIKLAQERATGVTVLVLPEYLIDVQEGDIIYLYARDSTNVGAMVNTHSFLTVEAV